MLLVEEVARVVDHGLRSRHLIFTDYLVNSPSEVLSPEDNILQVSQRDRDQTHGCDCPRAERDLVHRQAGDLIEHAASARDGLHWNVFVFKCEEQLDVAVDQDEDFVVVLILLEDVMAGLEGLGFHDENQFFIRLSAQVTEVINVQKKGLLPASILILILNEILLHCVFDIWENGYDFIECLLRDVPDVAVAFRLNGGRPSVGG